MGVLYDYFRAADAATVVRLMAENDGGSPDEVELVDAKGIDPVVSLGKLIGFIVDEPWSVDLVRSSLVWPSGDELEEHEGPWVEELGDRTRDALAGLDPARIPELATRWAGIEEFSGYADNELLASGITEMAALARNARDAGEHLYCWSSL
ncbi:hypothetical protein AB0M02_25435 [Actinoplanes sp. NPDC051861]|uniref:hypothetical protein n=1 Tax=Actinoplanes sp. NPDC051861 TaxID=3155170 RepID=UPI003428B8AE